ncbi:endonuclease 8-like 3 isoform X4 [Zonotrichia albicollis]|uniref:endonuclease 8-like 3 isoform X4 n=1 Tax=Zonotrichia albicollis TaxID=44394 RepID=UPI003D80CF31
MKLISDCGLSLGGRCTCACFRQHPGATRSQRRLHKQQDLPFRRKQTGSSGAVPGGPHRPQASGTFERRQRRRRPSRPWWRARAARSAPSACGRACAGDSACGPRGAAAARIHFGMNGSMHINPDGGKERNGAQPVLEIQLMEDTVCFWDVTVEYRNAAECEQKVRMMESLDVCSPKFSFSRAEREIKQQNTRMLCDVLLDQSVLPGVGNIIKNEALFDSGLHPALKVCQLTDEHIRHLVKMTRDFTLLFYKCRRVGSPLYPHYRVYRRAACRECRGSITVCRLGEHGRMTYFCSRCQKADPQLLNLSKLPARSSLIGWAYGRGSCSNEHVARKSEEEWTCMCCTLINKPSAEICDACLTPRPEVPKMESFEDSAAFNTNLMKYPCNDFRKPSTEIKINRKTAFGTTTLVLTDLGNKTVLRNDIQVSGGHSQCVFPKSNCKQIQSNACQSEGSTDKDCSPDVAALASSSCQQPVSFKHIQKKQKTDHVPLVHPYNTAISGLTWIFHFVTMASDVL